MMTKTSQLNWCGFVFFLRIACMYGIVQYMARVVDKNAAIAVI